ncbi:Thoeris anti-defense Tad2 family protein [Loigolactobacillus bifermentans]|nr:hypothetical protein [Loigolactobacillus bifermentans]QGG59107.1 DUF2829 domain-containing protein [Loigolactobacillus bifermentans]
MNIQQATRKALTTQKGITRESWDVGVPIIIIPTNTTGCCIVQVPGTEDELAPRWEPEAEDLLADDWRLCD